MNNSLQEKDFDMPDKNQKEELIQLTSDLEIAPSDELESGKIELKEYNNIPWDSTIFAGTALSSLLPIFRSITGNAQVAVSGLYKGDSLGKIGELAAAKDGTGYLGTIINNGNFVGQMRFHPIDSAPVNINATMPIDPMSLAIAAVVIEINMKLDSIQELQQEMFDYIKDRDRSKVKGSLHFLIDTLNEYKCIWDNKELVRSKLNEVQSIERDAREKMVLYRDQIAKKVSEQDAIHFGMNVDDRINSIKELFKDYKLSLGMYSFSVYLEVLLSEKFDEDYLQKKSAQIRDHSVDYKALYTDAYNALEAYSSSTIEQTVLKGLSFATKSLGNVLKDTPIGNATPIDEFLIESGDGIENFGTELSDNSVNKLTESKDSDVKLFADSIDKINEMYNHSMEFLFTDNGLCYRELPS